jgi:hypothetical protein
VLFRCGKLPLNKLENFIKSVDGRTIYVNPNDINATDSITNEGTSLTQPFKSIQRALLESARFSYIRGSDNDLIEKTTIVLSPATHYIDNRPGYGIKIDTGTGKAVAVSPGGAIITDPLEFFTLTPDTNFEVRSQENTVWHYNSIYGGVVIPRGTSIVGMDLRKTKIIPKYVPNPTDPSVGPTAIFRVTGGCYLYQFTIFDGDKDTVVYTDSRDFSENNQSVPTFSHHKLTGFEYADGVNIADDRGFQLTDLDMYYSKLSNAYNPASTRPIDEKYPELPESFTSRRPEFEIVGAFATDPIQISNLFSGDGFTPSALVNVTTIEPHGLDAETPIKIRGVSVSDYNVSTQVTNVIDPNTFTYSLNFVRPNLPASPAVSAASVTVETDTVSGSSPYIFNVSMRSVWGINGMLADGAKATGFRSMVVAQFTAISLQKDDRSFVKYNEQARRYDGINVSEVVRGAELSAQSSSTNTSTVYHLDPYAIYRPEWDTTHIKIKNDSIMQIVSVFAIGFNQHFFAQSGGDASITNSNSNFGQNALAAEGFKAEAFSKDDQGFISHIITPKSAYNPSRDSIENVQWTLIDFTETKRLRKSNQLFLFGYENEELPPPAIVGAYRVAANNADLLFQPLLNGGTREAVPVMSDSDPGSSNPSGESIGEKKIKVSTISGSIITFTKQHKLLDAEKVRLIASDGDLPENVQQDIVYYVIASNLSNNKIKIATSEANALNGVFLELYGSGANLNVVSRVNDKTSGEAGHPVQWDAAQGQWYILTEPESDIYNYILQASNEEIATVLPSFFQRIPDNRSLDDTVYRLRYVIPSTAINTKPPTPGYVIQKSATTGARTNSDFALSTLTSNDYGYDRNERFIYNANVNLGTSTFTFDTELPHNLRVGDEVRIININSSNNLTGADSSGFNGKFNVKSVSSSTTFNTSNVDERGFGRDPGAFTSNISDRNVLLPRFECINNQANLYIYRVETIAPLTEGIRDGIYHLYVLNSSNAVSETFTQKNYGQPLQYFYPQKDSDKLRENPPSSATYANRSPLGKVTVDNIQNSLARESIDKFIYTKNQNIISSYSNLADSVDITFETEHTFNGVYGFSSINSGSGYTNGVYYDVRMLDGGVDRGTTGKVTVSGGRVTAVEVMNPGSGYTNSGTLSIQTSDVGGSGSGASAAYNNTGLVDCSDMIVQVIGGGETRPAFYSYVKFIDNSKSLRLNYPPEYPRIDLKGMIVVPIDSGVRISSSSHISDGNMRLTTADTTRSSYLVGQSVVLYGTDGENRGTYYVTRVTGDNFDVYTSENLGSNSIGLVGRTGLDVNDAFTAQGTENIGIRGMVVYQADTLELTQKITRTSDKVEAVSFEANADTILSRRMALGQYIQIDSEIMRVSGTNFTGPNNNQIPVLRGTLGTIVTSHEANSRIRLIDPFAVELRRPSILRASGHTFEYLGYGPGNYSTALPQLQVQQLPEEEVYLAQSQKLASGQVVYTGMSDSGDFYIGNVKYSATSGQQTTFDIPVPSLAGIDQGGGTNTSDNLVIRRRLVVEGGPGNEIQSQFDGPVRFNKPVTFQSPISITSGLELGGALNLTELNVDNDATIGGRLTLGLDLKLNDGASSGRYVGLQGPATMSSTYSIRLPSAKPSNDQLLVSNGSGVTTWKTYYDQSAIKTLVTTEIEAQVPGIIDALVPDMIADSVPGIVDPIIDAEISTQVPLLISSQVPGIVHSELDDAISDGAQVGLSVSYNKTLNELDIKEYDITTTASNKTLATNEYCTVTTTAARTITLPRSPSVGDRVAVGVLNTKSITIGRNSQRISGVAQNMLIDYEYADIQFIYIGGDVGWKLR